MNHKLIKFVDPKTRTEFALRDGSSDYKSVEVTWIKKSYNRPSLPFIVESGDKWVDFGANIGAFSVYAALKSGNIVHAYEPESGNCQMIKINSELNQLGDRVRIHQKAIVPNADDGKELKFYISTNPASYRRHTLYGNYLNSENKKKIDIQSITGIGFNKALGDADCVKMNIEGAEIPIIREMTDARRIKKMVFEYSFDMDKRISTFVETMNKLQSVFRVVKPSRKIPLDMEFYPYYPPNCYIFCTQ